MSKSRIEVFSALLEKQAADPMIWYGLANEYFKMSDWEKAAEALCKVVEFNPSYTAAYQMLGSALANLGKIPEARQMWERGVSVATETGAWKARQHMEGLLAQHQTDSTSPFCS
ncbi:MAG TPA: tetratricopeptide repeat protein [Acidobacteriota bacterium]|nr:tetratricopeptide repeat protein [Acidobacteriota bacterium]HMZ79342.1 tetratricopeptide repeat protein [Acidobacteriota bacterium]HNB70886.1 tetratricopeptide repeat protein [Acidobacteriota bacterium]HND21859.1 tetratricopeptide repeat protein [Acidobacteriota bacterium]HNG91922.1 tetratricopeptide repeat protein [Acidobacteriota bacterium]